MTKQRLEEIIQRQSMALEQAVDREEKLSRENARLHNELADAADKIRTLTLELNRKSQTEIEQ